MTPRALTALAVIIAGCCEGNPDNPWCQDDPAAGDAGVPCWSEHTEPVDTIIHVEAPATPRLHGCLQQAPDGICETWLGAAPDAPRQPGSSPLPYLPAGIWTTHARGLGCPGVECAATVGEVRTRWHVIDATNEPRSEVISLCHLLPHPRRAAPEGLDRLARPPELTACGADAGLVALAATDRVPDIEAGGYHRTWLLEPALLPGAEYARRAERYIRCVAAACGARNAWRGDPLVVDPDGDAVHTRCDNCDAVANPDQRDGDGDRWGDVCDSCPTVASGQSDIDGDGVGDACDVCPELPDDQGDADGDGVGDGCDTCPLNPHAAQDDRDGDGVGDACDLCPDDPGAWRGDRDGDGVGDGCDVCPDAADPEQGDRDGDGVGDACDLCVAVADPAQADSDGDGIGDACCGDDDPDDDGVANCHYYPPGHPEHGQVGAPTTDPAWTEPWPGRVSCEAGQRRCRPAGEPEHISEERAAAYLRALAAGQVPRPANHPASQRWPPTFSEFDPANLALGRCALAEATVSAGWTDETAALWTLDDYERCVEDEEQRVAAGGEPGGQIPAAPWESRMPARFGFGIYGEKFVYLTMGFAVDNDCEPNVLYKDVVVDGRRRRGELDILCVYEDHSTIVEVKWYNTHRYWPPNGRRAFNDQVRRQFAFMEQQLGGTSRNRWQMIFGFRPPPTIRRILDHTWLNAAVDGLRYDYPPVFRTLFPVEGLTGWGARHTWYQVNRGDFRVSRVLPLIDEGPCTICSLEDAADVAASPACEWTQAQIGELPLDFQLSPNAPYFSPVKAQAWLAEYARRCITGRADCPEGLQYFYDLMACQEF